MKLPDFPTWFLATPAGQAAIDADRNERNEKRQRLIDELATLDAEHAKASPMAAKKVQETRAKAIAAREAATQAERAHNAAVAAAGGASAVHTNRRASLLHKLREMTPEVVDFERELRVMLDESRMEPTSSSKLLGTGARSQMVSATNYASISARCAAIGNALRECESLLIESTNDVPLAIAAVRGGIPEISEEPDWSKVAKAKGLALA